MVVKKSLREFFPSATWYLFAFSGLFTLKEFLLEGGGLVLFFETVSPVSHPALKLYVAEDDLELHIFLLPKC